MTWTTLHSYIWRLLDTYHWLFLLILTVHLIHVATCKHRARYRLRLFYSQVTLLKTLYHLPRCTARKKLNCGPQNRHFHANPSFERKSKSIVLFIVVIGSCSNVLQLHSLSSRPNPSSFYRLFLLLIFSISQRNRNKYSPFLHTFMGPKFSSNVDEILLLFIVFNSWPIPPQGHQLQKGQTEYVYLIYISLT